MTARLGKEIPRDIRRLSKAASAAGAGSAASRSP